MKPIRFSIDLSKISEEKSLKEYVKYQWQLWICILVTDKN